MEKLEFKNSHIEASYADSIGRSTKRAKFETACMKDAPVLEFLLSEQIKQVGLVTKLLQLF